MRWSYHDGGRAAAGFTGTTGDCVTRAIAIATGRPYQEVYDSINQHALAAERRKRRKTRSSARTGVHRDTTRTILEAYGWLWVPVMKIGSGCTMHVRATEVPVHHPRLILSLSRHIVAVVDGVLQDTHDPSRNGRRCVYGYYIPRLQ